MLTPKKLLKSKKVVALRSGRLENAQQEIPGAESTTNR